MSDVRPDDLLWELPRAEAGDDAPPPPDRSLEAYRARALSPAEEAEVEWRLAASRRGRVRLAELAGLRLDEAPSPAGRRPLLVSAMLAAAAVLVIGAVLVLTDGVHRELPEFELRAQGLAETRGAPGEARALPDGPVRVVVEPRGEAIPGLTFAAYRLDGHALTRLAQPEEVRIDVDRGSATIVAPAARLVGRSPGTRPFYVLVTARADPPRRLDVGAEGPTAALRRSGDGRVYEVALTILEPTESEP